MPEKEAFAKVYGLIIELVLFNILCLLVGYSLDRYLSSSPLFIVLAVFLNLAGTIWMLIRFTKSE